MATARRGEGERDDCGRLTGRPAARGSVERQRRAEHGGPARRWRV